jgi:TP901 family phage tail tape measure protein
VAEIAALEVVLRSRSAQVGAKKVQTEIKKVGTAATAAQAKVGASTAAMGGAFAKLKSMIFSVQALLLTLGIGIGLVATIGTLKEFEYTMAGVRAVTGASIEEFGLLTDKARELGATTIFAATEAAEGMRLLGLAGFSVSEALGAVEGTLNLAAAGSLGLGEASAITANIIRSFRLEAEKASEIADILAKTATNANTTVGGLGNAFSFVGAVARAANQSVADTAAVLGVLTDAGFDASRAGTGLRRVLGEILVGNEDLVARLPELGLTIEDINLQTNSMVDVFQKLAPLAMDAAFALEVFGQRGGPAFLAVVGQADRMELLADKTNKAGGAAKEIAEILTNTLQGSIKLLKSAVEELILALGDMGLTMWMKTLADNIRGVITVFNGMGETLGENQARFEAMAETLRAYTIFVAALGTVHLIKLAASFQFLTRAVKAATLAMMRNPFMLIGVAIAAVITWLFTLRNRVTEATGEIFKMGDAYGEIFHQIWGLVKDVITLWGVFGNTAEDAGEKADEAFTGVGAAIVFHVLSTINDAIRDVRLLGIWLSEIPHMMRNWGEISDEGFQKLLDIAEPLGARAGKRFAAGFKKEVDPRMLAEFEVAIKDVLLQAQGLERTVVTISSLNMGT